MCLSNLCNYQRIVRIIYGKTKQEWIFLGIHIYVVLDLYS
jgi:hypothetical protein